MKAFWRALRRTGLPRFGLISLLMGCGGSVTAAGIALMVPAYFGSASPDWARLVAAARRVPLVAIANAANGPGAACDVKLKQRLEDLRAAGGQVTGYVYTKYGGRPLGEVEADIRNWSNWYPLDGLFVDEMDNRPTAASLDYYEALYRFASTVNSGWRITGNPGTRTDEAFVTRSTADTLVVFENDQGYTGYLPDSWASRYPPSRFCHLVYSLTNSATLTNFLGAAIRRRAGFVYVTDDGRDGNPWDRLPVFWDAEVSWVEANNRTAARAQPALLRLERPNSAGSGWTLMGSGVPGRYGLESGAVLDSWSLASSFVTLTGEIRQPLPAFSETQNRYVRLVAP